MTEHKIDLDLVELRCKLRGWQYLRREHYRRVARLGVRL